MAGALLTFALLVATGGAGHAQTSAIEPFLAELKRASQNGDRAAIAEMVRYPITISIAGLRIPFPDRAAFLERYDDIFNPALRDIISNASVSTASVIGANEVVVSEVNGELRIVSITVPPDTGRNSTAAASPTDRSAGATRKPEPRRIAIRVGPGPTQIPGLLSRDGREEFIVFLPRGRLAGIRLERAPVGSAVIRVVHARTGVPLAARASADGRYVSGRAAQDGDYRIEVRAIANGDGGQLRYMLSLSLR